VALLSDKERRLLEMAEDRKNLVRERERILSKPTLTAEERKRIRNINSQLATISRRLAALVKTLDRRLSSLPEDLRIILNAKSLRSLVAIRRQYFDYITPLWQEIHKPVAGFNYSSWQIKQVRSAKRSVREPSRETRKKIIRYWLDMNIEPEPTIEDVFKPTYAIRGIKSKVWFKIIHEAEPGLAREKYDVRTILEEAVELEFRHSDQIRQGQVRAILPKNEHEAMDIYKVKNAITNFRESIRDKHEINGE
jgi:hypothetical protein